MRSRLWIWSGLLFVGMLSIMSSWASSTAYAQMPDREFTMAVGETLTINARGVTRITIGMPDVADAIRSSDGSLLLITGKSAGVTTINIFSDEGQKSLLMRIVGVNPISLAEEVRETLGERSGVDVRVIKGRVLLEGEVTSGIFNRKIEKLTELYPNQVLNFTTFREAFVEGARMVALDVYFIQVATTGSDRLGVQWSQFLGANFSFGSGDVPLYYSADGDDLGSGVVPPGGTSTLPRPVGLTGGSGLNSYWSLVGNLNIALDFLVENGLIKTVQQATIITEAGTEAEFHTGGTLMIPVSGQVSGDLVEKPYGLNVKFMPILDFENRVKLNVHMTYSELDYASSVGDIPGLRNNEIVSVVNMNEGQSVLVSGQHNVVNTSNESGLWMLSRIPILGWLFKSRNSLKTSLDNAMFVTPRIYEPGGEMHRTLIQGIFEGLLEQGAEPEDLPVLSSSSQ